MPVGFSFTPARSRTGETVARAVQTAGQEIENENKQYAQDMDRAANDAFAEALDERGLPNFAKYTQGLRQRGAFSPDHAAMSYEYLAKTLGSTAAAGQSLADIEGVGMTPETFTTVKAKPTPAPLAGDPSAAMPDAGPRAQPAPQRVNDSIGESQSATGYDQAPAPHLSEAMFKPQGEIQVTASPAQMPAPTAAQYDTDNDYVKEMLASRKPMALGEMSGAEADFQRLRGGNVPGLVNAPNASGINPSTQIRENAAAWMASKGRLIDGDVDASWQALNEEAYQAAAQKEIGTPPNRSLLANGRDGRIKYNAEKLAYEASLRKADAAGQQAQLDLSKALEEGNTKKADAIIASRGTSVVIDGKTYAAFDNAAAQTVRKLAPIKSLIEEAHDLLKNPRSYQDLKQLAPMITKITSAILTPGGGITEGMIKETEKSALGSDDASLAHIAVMLGLQLAAQKSGDKAAQASAAKQLQEFLAQMDPTVAQRNLRALLHAAEKGLQDHYRANVIGYKGGVKEEPIGSLARPFPAGKEPPIGAHYIHPTTGQTMKRVK